MIYGTTCLKSLYLTINDAKKRFIPNKNNVSHKTTTGRKQMVQLGGNWYKTNSSTIKTENRIMKSSRQHNSILIDNIDRGK